MPSESRAILSSEFAKTTRRALVFDFTDANRIKMVADLAYRHNWEPAFWFSSDNAVQLQIVKFFPNAQFINKLDAARHRWPGSVPASQWPHRDNEIVQKLAPYDPVLHSVFLRETKSRCGMEQMAEYHKSITQWSQFFDYAKPDILLYDNIPSQMYEFLPYLLAKIYGIPALFLLRPRQIPGAIMASNDYEVPAPRVVSYYRRLLASGEYRAAQLNALWDVFYDRMTGDYTRSMPTTFARKYKVVPGKDKVKVKSHYWGQVKDILQRIKAGRNYRVQLRALLYEVRTIPRRLRLRWVYESSVVEPDFDAPYVFVALHVQPERTSIPQGGVFGHQLLMVEMLSRALPEGWRLYVKEHPVQLYTRAAGRQFRTPQFYREVQKIPKVELVSASTSSRAMIRHAKAVASATSNACWEAIFQGKPALVCGSVFFSFFEGIFHAQSVEECARAFEEIRDGYQVDQEKVRACLYAIQEKAVTEPSGIVDDAMQVGEADRGTWTYFIDELASQIGEDGRIKPLAEDAP